MDMNIKNINSVVCESIRVKGIVQGVGLRPTVWRIANNYGLKGNVINDANGVLIKVQGKLKSLNEFVKCLKNETPPLARIDSIERQIINDKS